MPAYTNRADCSQPGTVSFLKPSLSFIAQFLPPNVGFHVVFRYTVFSYKKKKHDTKKCLYHKLIEILTDHLLWILFCCLTIVTMLLQMSVITFIKILSSY